MKKTRIIKIISIVLIISLTLSLFTTNTFARIDKRKKLRKYFIKSHHSVPTVYF